MSEGHKRERALWGEPDVSFGALKLWIHRYEFPHLDDECDGNWLVATARAVVPGACSIEISGPFVSTQEIAGFRDSISRLQGGFVGSIALETLEPELNWELEANASGHVSSEVRLKGDGHEHLLSLQADQTYLPLLVEQLERILERFPIRGVNKEST